MKEYEVNTEVTIAKTVTVMAASEEDAQVTARTYLDTIYSRLGHDYWRPDEDDIVIEIGDAEEVIE